MQFRRYYDNPTVVILERDYRTWNGTLPAATLCYSNNIDSLLAEEYIQKLVLSM